MRSIEAIQRERKERQSPRTEQTEVGANSIRCRVSRVATRPLNFTPEHTFVRLITMSKTRSLNQRLNVGVVEYFSNFSLHLFQGIVTGHD